MTKQYNDEYGFVNHEVSNDGRVLVSMMEESQYKEYPVKWGYTPNRFKINIDNGCGLAYSDSFKTFEELFNRIDKINFLGDDEKAFLKSIIA